MNFADQTFQEMEAHYKSYRDLFPDKSQFSCWANMCLNEYLDGEIQYTLIRDSWEEFMKYRRIKLNKKRFKQRKRK